MLSNVYFNYYKKNCNLKVTDTNMTWTYTESTLAKHLYTEK